MTDIVVLVEEPSAAIIVKALASRFAATRAIRVIEHVGKSDLRESYPRKIRAWVHPPGCRFVVLIDNDGANCLDNKRRLMREVPSGRRERVRVRLVLQQLEAWYLGDFSALRRSGVISDADFRRWSRKRKFREPDALPNAKEEYRRLSRIQGQRAIARALGPEIDPDTNASPSLRLFVRTLTDDWG